MILFRLRTQILEHMVQEVWCIKKYFPSRNHNSTKMNNPTCIFLWFANFQLLPSSRYQSQWCPIFLHSGLWSYHLSFQLLLGDSSLLCPLVQKWKRVLQVIIFSPHACPRIVGFDWKTNLAKKKYLNSEKPISIEERNHSPFSWQPLQSLCRILWHFYSAGHLSLPWNAPPPSPLHRPFSPPFPPFLLPCTLYSFRPGRERPISVHPVAGVTVEVEGSSIHQVTSRKTTTKTKTNNFQVKLSQLSLASTGRYRCEVNFGGKITTWKKAPRSAKRDRSLQLTPSLATCWSSLCRDTVRASSAGRIGGSKYFPTWLELDASRYQVGENLRMNCTSGVRASYWNQGLDRIFQ